MITTTHNSQDLDIVAEITPSGDTKFIYTFENFFHPFVGELIEKLNKESLPGMLDARWQKEQKTLFFHQTYDLGTLVPIDRAAKVESFPKEFDVSGHGPYANYNWELFFHIPLAIATHLSKNQRFAEAQRWFHFIFDPTSNDTSVPQPDRYWKFLAFRNGGDVTQIDKLLGYWDTVADRLFKIRHCMNIEGVVRPLALFDPPIDPGMLVKAAAAGIDIGAIVSGLNQPIGPARCLFLIQKAMELAGEVRGLGAALLSAIEKGDSERLALLRQDHEIKIQQMTQEARFLQWKSAEEATKSLGASRASALERLRYYQRLLGLPTDKNAPDSLTLDHRELTGENFDEVYIALVGQYDKQITPQRLSNLTIVGGASPSQQSGASGQGKLHLSSNEDADLNQHAPESRDYRTAATVSDAIHSILGFIPDMGIDAHFWGLGGHAVLFGGSLFAGVGRIISSSLNTKASHEDSQGASASKTAGYERRADEWILQYNLAANRCAS